MPFTIWHHADQKGLALHPCGSKAYAAISISPNDFQNKHPTNVQIKLHVLLYIKQTVLLKFWCLFLTKIAQNENNLKL